MGNSHSPGSWFLRNGFILSDDSNATGPVTGYGNIVADLNPSAYQPDNLTDDKDGDYEENHINPFEVNDIGKLEREANARLICAAPEMYEFLKKIKDEGGVRGDYFYTSIQLLKKISGEQPASV